MKGCTTVIKVYVIDISHNLWVKCSCQILTLRSFIFVLLALTLVYTLYILHKVEHIYHVSAPSCFYRQLRIYSCWKHVFRTIISLINLDFFPPSLYWKTQVLKMDGYTRADSYKWKILGEFYIFISDQKSELEDQC